MKPDTKGEGTQDIKYNDLLYTIELIRENSGNQSYINSVCDRIVSKYRLKEGTQQEQPVVSDYFPPQDENDEKRQLQLCLLGLVYDGKAKKRDDFYYFIEDDRTGLWLTRKHEWTNNPHECMKFEYEAFALVYADHLSPKCYKITEHEFVENTNTLNFPPKKIGDDSILDYPAQLIKNYVQLQDDYNKLLDDYHIVFLQLQEFKVQSHPHPQQVVSESEIEEAINVNCGTGEDSDIPAFYFRMGIEWYQSRLQQEKGEELITQDECTKQCKATMEFVNNNNAMLFERLHDLYKFEEEVYKLREEITELKSKELSGMRWTDQDMIKFADLCRGQLYTDRSSESLFNAKYKSIRSPKKTP